VLNREVPFLRICIPFFAGILSGLLFCPEELFFIPAFSIPLLVLVSSMSLQRFNKGTTYGIALSLLLFFSGLFLYKLEKSQISELPEQEIICYGVIDDYPEEKDNSYSLVLRLAGWRSADTTCRASGGILLYIAKDSSIRNWLPGDKLILKCRVSPIVNHGNPGEFNYKFYMQNKGTAYTAYAGTEDILYHKVTSRRSLKHRALIVRQRIIEMYRERGISGDNLALTAAITLGDKELLDPVRKETYIKAGVMHVMAVSGMHAVILSLFIFKIFFFLKGRFNWVRILTALLVLWTFTFVTGLTASVLRASVMYTFMQAGKLMKRPVNGLNSLLASALVLALIKPSVIFEAGFLLSYSAVLFIISFYNDLYRLTGFRYFIPDLIWQSAAVSIVAQAGTFPLTISMFNRFPALFLVANLMIVPLSSMIIIAGCMVPLFYHIRPVSGVFAFILEKLTELTDLLTGAVASVPGSSIGNLGISTAACIILTAAIYLFAHNLLKIRASRVTLKAGWLLLFVFTIFGTAQHVHTRLTSELVVYNSYSGLSIGLRKGNQLNVVSDSSATNAEALRHAAVLRAKVDRQSAGEIPFLIKAGSKNILVTESIDNKQLSKYVPDVVVISGRTNPVSENFHPEGSRTYVFTGKNVRISGLKDNFVNTGQDSLHFVEQSGAYRLKVENKSTGF
jgi:competence protein ComEC